MRGVVKWLIHTARGKAECCITLRDHDLSAINQVNMISPTLSGSLCCSVDNIELCGADYEQVRLARALVHTIPESTIRLCNLWVGQCTHEVTISFIMNQIELFKSGGLDNYT